MATFARKKLAFIQLPNTTGDVYDPAASTIGLIHNIILYNNNTTTETVILEMYDGTNTYQLFQVIITTKDTVIIDFKGEGLIVDALSKITGSTTTALKVTCLITGSEETA